MNTHYPKVSSHATYLCHEVIVSHRLRQLAMEPLHKVIQHTQYNESHFITEGTLHLDMEGDLVSGGRRAGQGEGSGNCGRWCCLWRYNLGVHARMC